jgi:serine/threonine protein kinase
MTTSYLGQQFGNYELTRLLGRGNFAQVYLGEHLYLNTQAAIKILNAQLEEDLELFRREARTIARLVHPNIVRVLEFGVEDDMPFLVLDYAARGTVRQRYPKGTLLSVPTVISYTKQVAEALQYAHDERVVHRDVKPENLLLGRNDEVLLSDFGVALMSMSMRDSFETDMAGTPSYMAPEQIQKQALPASDQYALAVVVYEWLAGELPFSGSFMELLTQHISASPPSLRATRPTISPGIEQVVMKALAKNPNERYPNVRAFALALEHAGLATTAPTRSTMLPDPGPRGTTSANPSPITPIVSDLLSSQNRIFSLPPTPLPAAPLSAPLPASPLDSRTRSASLPGALISVYQGHVQAVQSLSWLADGRRIISASRDKQVHVWDAFTGIQFQTYQDQSGFVLCVAGSSDGAFIATAGADGLVRVWDFSSNTFLTIYRGQSGQIINSLAWAPDHPLLASAGSDGGVHVWDATSGKTLAVYRGHTGNVNSVAWSPEANTSPLGGGYCLVSGGDDTTVQTWEALTARPITTYYGPAARVLRVAWSPSVYASSLSKYAPNSSRVACGREDGTVQMWDTVAKREVLNYQYAAATSVVAWSPEGLRFACATATKHVEVWDINTNLRLVSFAHTTPPLVMAWSPDGMYIASGGGDTSIQVWRAPARGGAR